MWFSVILRTGLNWGSFSIILIVFIQLLLSEIINPRLHRATNNSSNLYIGHSDEKMGKIISNEIRGKIRLLPGSRSQRRLQTKSSDAGS